MGWTARLKFTVILGMVMAQSDCATHVASVSAPASSISAACQTERIAFRQSSHDWGGSPMLTPGDYAQVLNTQAKDYLPRLMRLQQDTRTLDQSIERLTADYRALLDCKAGLRMNTPPTVDQDLNLARQDASAVRQQEINLRTAVDLLFTQNNGLKQKVWRALSAPPVPTLPQIAMAPGVIRAKPADNATQIALVRKGDRIVASDDQSPSGWTAITLNDGTTGYVDATILRPARVSPSAMAQASEARQARDAANDPVVSLARVTRENLPQHRASFGDLVESSAAPAGNAQVLSSVSSPQTSGSNTLE